MNQSILNPLYELLQTLIIRSHLNAENIMEHLDFFFNVGFLYVCSFSNKILHNTVGPNSLSQVKMQGPFKVSGLALTDSVQRLKLGCHHTHRLLFSASVTDQCRPKANVLFLFVMVSIPNAF